MTKRSPRDALVRFMVRSPRSSSSTARATEQRKQEMESKLTTAVDLSSTGEDMVDPSGCTITCFSENATDLRRICVVGIASSVWVEER